MINVIDHYHFSKYHHFSITLMSLLEVQDTSDTANIRDCAKSAMGRFRELNQGMLTSAYEWFETFLTDKVYRNQHINLSDQA